MMTTALAQLEAALPDVLGQALVRVERQRDEFIAIIDAAQWLTAAQQLRDHASLRFEQLIDIAGMDYSAYADSGLPGGRYAAVYQLLSVQHNWRLRAKVYAREDELPVLPSMVDVWPVANWFEREAFDLLGIVFEGHPDLRRLLTDYGFIGHPLRKDFPLSGNVEMRYDPDQRRVIYQPVTIEPREVVPRIIREEGYGDGR